MGRGVIGPVGHFYQPTNSINQSYIHMDDPIPFLYQLRIRSIKLVLRARARVTMCRVYNYAPFGNTKWVPERCVLGMCVCEGGCWWGL